MEMIDAINIVFWGVIVGCIAGWLLKLADKWHVLDWLEVNAPNDFVWKLVTCEFCRTWWTGVVLCVLLLTFVCEWWVVLVPFVSLGVALKFGK